MTRRRMCISGPSPLRGGGKEGGSMNDEQARIARGGLLVRRRPSRIVIVLAAVFCALAGPAGAQLASLSHERGAAGLGLALRRLPVGARVLYVTAHPDDEHNGVLVRLARGLGVRTALLTVTRGDGGQNYIGPELFDALAVLRTEELLAIHRYDGVEQFFGRASDFGFSFSVEETFEKWGREETLGDVVRVVRSFRPDVILTLPLEAPGGGQHHQASARRSKGRRSAFPPEWRTRCSVSPGRSSGAWPAPSTVRRGPASSRPTPGRPKGCTT